MVESSSLATRKQFWSRADLFFQPIPTDTKSIPARTRSIVGA